MSAAAIGRYRFLRDLGQGAAAHVFLARDPTSGRQVAVKLLDPALTAGPAFAERFNETLKRLVGLAHPYLVPTVDFGCEEDQYFVVQRYMPGGTLADRLDGRPMLLSEVLVLLERLVSALDAAHTGGVFHGDLNPAHILYDVNSRAFIADLGLAPLLQGTAPAPATQPSLPGLPAAPAGGWERFVTPAYMSPEQAAGGPVDARSDVYALGVIVYEMLTGRQPFVAVTPEGVARQQVEAAVPRLGPADLAQLVLPEAFNQVMARALAKDSALRYPTAGVLADAMRTMFLEPDAPTATPAAPALLAPAEAPAPAVAPPAPPAFEPPAAEPSEIVRAEWAAPPPPNYNLLLGLGGAGVVFVLVLLALARWMNLGGFGVPPTLTPTLTATPTVVLTLTPSPEPSRTGSPTASATLTATLSPSATVTRTRTPRPTATPSPTASSTRPPTQPAFTATPDGAGAAPLPFPATATPAP